MSGFKTIAIAGVGNIGSFIAEELLNAKDAGKLESVVVLTRPGSSNKHIADFTARGAKIAEVSYDTPSTLTSALKGVDAVISTIVAFDPSDPQLALIKAAKEAGVKLFVPSEFGSDTQKRAEGFGRVKAGARKTLTELELPWTAFITGGFADFIWIPILGLDISSGKISVGAPGTAPASFTSRRDIARYVAWALTTEPLSTLSNKFYHIEGSRVSFAQVAELYEKKHGKKLEVELIPREELLKRIKANPHDFAAVLHLEWADGFGPVGEPVDNYRWKEFNPKSVEEFL